MIAVIGVDLFGPVFTHVLGQAREGGKCAVISLFRLRRRSDRSPAPMSLLLDRAFKVAFHELGHLFGLSHCMDGNCLMHFSGGLEDLDRIRLEFCEYCGLFGKDALRRTGIHDRPGIHAPPKTKHTVEVEGDSG